MMNPKTHWLVSLLWIALIIICGCTPTPNVEHDFDVSDSGWVTTWLEPARYQYFYDGVCYKFRTPDGDIVIDPILEQVNNISRPTFIRTFYDDWDRFYAPVLILGSGSFYVAALDGSWITSEQYTSYNAVENGIFLVNRQEEYVFLNWDGSVRFTGQHSMIKNANMNNAIFASHDNPRYSQNHLYVTDREEGVYLLDYRFGKMLLLETVDKIYYFGDGLAPARSTEQLYQDGEYSYGCYGYIDEDGNWFIDPQYRSGGRFHHGEALVTNLEGRDLIINLRNEVVYEFETVVNGACFWSTGSFYWAEDQYRCVDYYSRQLDTSQFDPLNQVLLPMINTVYSSYPYYYDEGETGCVVLAANQPYFIPEAEYIHTLVGDYAWVWDFDEESEWPAYWYNMKDGSLFAPYDLYDYVWLELYDENTGEYYFTCKTIENIWECVDGLGNVLFTFQEDDRVELQHGIFVVNRVDGVEFIDKQGNSIPD